MLTLGLKMLHEACLGQDFKDLGRRFSQHGPPNRQITYMY